MAWAASAVASAAAAAARAVSSAWAMAQAVGPWRGFAAALGAFAATCACAVAAAYAAYRSQWIVPSRSPRRSPMTDGKSRAKTYVKYSIGAGSGKAHWDRAHMGYSPPYPNGWFPLLFSHEVRPGGVMQVDALGRRFAVFRGKSGKVGVLDAFCPHGGASLCGPTAQVVGENIQCPFHLMEFDTHGRVVKVPWLDAGVNGAAAAGGNGDGASGDGGAADSGGAARKRKLPAANDALAWHCGEWHGYICVWFDAEKRPPAYALPAVSELKTMRYCGRWLVDRPIYMHLQEFTENTVDVQHFTPMHGSMALPWTNSDVPGINVAFASKVVLGRDKEALKYDADARPEYLYFINESSISFLGRGVPRTSATVVVKFVGPGGLVRFLFTLPNVGEILMQKAGV